MGKHSTPDEMPERPVFEDATDGKPNEDMDEIGLRITALPREEGPMGLLVNYRPFMHVQIGRGETEAVTNVQVLYGGGLESGIDGLLEMDTAGLARYFREVAEMIEQGGAIAAKKTEAQRAEDDEKWTDFLSRAADDRLTVSDSEVGEPSLLAPGAIDYTAGAAFANERCGKSAAQQDAEDLTLLGADEVVEAELMDDEETP